MNYVYSLISSSPFENNINFMISLTEPTEAAKIVRVYRGHLQFVNLSNPLTSRMYEKRDVTVATMRETAKKLQDELKDLFDRVDRDHDNIELEDVGHWPRTVHLVKQLGQVEQALRTYAAQQRTLESDKKLSEEQSQEIEIAAESLRMFREEAAPHIARCVERAQRLIDNGSARSEPNLFRPYLAGALEAGKIVSEWHLPTISEKIQHQIEELAFYKEPSFSPEEHNLRLIASFQNDALAKKLYRAWDTTIHEVAETSYNPIQQLYENRSRTAAILQNSMVNISDRLKKALDARGREEDFDWEAFSNLCIQFMSVSDGFSNFVTQQKLRNRKAPREFKDLDYIPLKEGQRHADRALQALLSDFSRSDTPELRNLWRSIRSFKAVQNHAELGDQIDRRFAI